MTFDPTSVEVTCVTLPKDHCVQVPWTYIKVCGYSDLFCQKNLNQRSLTPRWPLTPHLLRSHVWLYPRIIVSKSHENTSKYVDTVNLFVKTWTKGHWPLDDLWPHICWGHMCDSSQGSLCPSSMGIHQCMWIQWSILQKLPHTYIHILILHTHTTYRISDHIVSFWTTFRRDKKVFRLKTIYAPYPKLFFRYVQWKDIKEGENNPGGYANYFLMGCVARGLKPLPISKDFSPSKNGWFLGFFQNFRKLGSISKGFSTSKMADFTIFHKFCEIRPSFKDFFLPKWDLCLRIFDEKVIHLGDTSPYVLTCTYSPPPPPPGKQ